jgi:hypothetical protein
MKHMIILKNYDIHMIHHYETYRNVEIQYGR